MLGGATTSTFRHYECKGTAVEAVAYTNGKGLCFLHIPSKNVIIKDYSRDGGVTESKISKDEFTTAIANKVFQSKKVNVPVKLACELEQLEVGSCFCQAISKVCGMFFETSCEK